MQTSFEAVVIVGGGQTGLATARAAAGPRPVVLRPGTPRRLVAAFYDSLKVFSPFRFNSFREGHSRVKPTTTPTRGDEACGVTTTEKVR